MFLKETMHYLLLMLRIAPGVLDRSPHEEWYLIPLSILSPDEKPTLSVLNQMAGQTYIVMSPTILLPVREDHPLSEQRPTQDEILLQSLLRELAGIITTTIRWKVYHLPTKQPLSLKKDDCIKNVVSVQVYPRY
jgi:hypothetical protein